jgi:hypothetical protein
MNRRNFIVACGLLGAQLFLPKIIKPHWKHLPFKGNDGIFHDIIVRTTLTKGEKFVSKAHKILCSEAEAARLASDMGNQLADQLQKPLGFVQLNYGDSLLELIIHEVIPMKPIDPEHYNLFSKINGLDRKSVSVGLEGVVSTLGLNYPN